MKHISEVVASIFDRGSLPRKVRTLQDLGPISAGSVLTWSDANSAYQTESTAWIVWAITVRQMWHVYFCEYTDLGAHPEANDQQTSVRAA